jgi:hypothetical protein
MARYEDANWRDSMRIRFDYTNMMADAVGKNRGPTDAELDEMEFRLSAALDVLRMRRIHGTAMSYPGNDRFAFHVFEHGRGYLVEFPNCTTRMCPELIAKLKQLAGAENVRIEPILFQ